MDDEDQQPIGLFALEKCEPPAIDDSADTAVATTFESSDTEIQTSTKCATTGMQRDISTVNEESVERQTEDCPQDTPRGSDTEQTERQGSCQHLSDRWISSCCSSRLASTSKTAREASDRRQTVAPTVSSEISIDVEDISDDRSRPSETEVAQTASCAQVDDVCRQKGSFLVDQKSSRTVRVHTASGIPVATSLAHLFISTVFTALPGRSQRSQHEEEDIDDDDESRFPAWMSLRASATRDEDSTTPSTVSPSTKGRSPSTFLQQDAMTYRRAIERVRVIQEEEDQQLFTKKNFYATLFLKLKRWRRSFQFSIWSTRIQVRFAPISRSPLFREMFFEAVEGKHGSNVGLTLYFLRWTVLLNLFISLLWIVFTVVPFVVYPPDTFSWNLFTKSSTTDLISVRQRSHLCTSVCVSE